MMKTKMMKLKPVRLMVFLACAVSGQAFATPVFQLGADNTLGFQSVGNKTGDEAIQAGDLIYGIINGQDVTTGETLWNANNVSSIPPIDSFSGYFLTRIDSVTIIPGPEGLSARLGLGVADSDPNGVLSASELSSGAMMKLFTDNTTAFTTGGSVSTDIANATDGSHWGTLGFNSPENYWTVALSSLSPSGTSFGGINFIENNTGMEWEKVLDTSCDTPGGCEVDMKFNATYAPRAEGDPWQVNFNDPATVHPVPLPAAAWLFGSGMIALAGLPLRRKKRKLAEAA